jgi:hypothetical protein
VNGFSPRVKLLVRTRAGGGDPSLATCESCGVWLGETGGEHQHRVARGAGGCKDPVINGPANCALMCHFCHRQAESRDPKHRMEERGFVIRHGVGPGYDPRFVPVILFGGVEVWLSETEPRYLYEPPAERAA